MGSELIAVYLGAQLIAYTNLAVTLNVFIWTIVIVIYTIVIIVLIYSCSAIFIIYL